MIARSSIISTIFSLLLFCPLYSFAATASCANAIQLWLWSTSPVSQEARPLELIQYKLDEAENAKTRNFYYRIPFVRENPFAREFVRRSNQLVFNASWSDQDTDQVLLRYQKRRMRFLLKHEDGKYIAVEGIYSGMMRSVSSQPFVLQITKKEVEGETPENFEVPQTFRFGFEDLILAEPLQ